MEKSQKGGNFVNQVNRKHILPDSIRNNQQKARKRHFLLEHFKEHQKQKKEEIRL